MTDHLIKERFYMDHARAAILAKLSVRSDRYRARLEKARKAHGSTIRILHILEKTGSRRLQIEAGGNIYCRKYVERGRV